MAKEIEDQLVLKGVNYRMAPNAVVDIPVRLNFGVFALQYMNQQHLLTKKRSIRLDSNLDSGK